MFGNRENNKIIIKGKNGFTAEAFVEFVKTVNTLATTFPRVTVCFELEGDFVKSEKQCDDGDDQSESADDARI